MWAARVRGGAPIAPSTPISRVSCVREVIPAAHGDFDIVLDDGTDLSMSRRYRSRLLT